MMKKILSVIFMVFVLILFWSFIYLNLPQEPVEMILDNISYEAPVVIAYEDTPVFIENLRFNHNNISYFLESECDGVRKESMIEAFEIFENEMRLISFHEIKNKTEADIGVGCSDNYIEFEENLFVAGEGGPSRIINTSVFKMIEKGKISLYRDPRCDYPVISLHELLHVFGFDHSDNPDNIMYNTSKCSQRITNDMIKLIDRLYSVEPLADAIIDNLTAIKKGRYLDFNITVLNEGLIGIDSINLTIFADGREFQTIDLGDLGIGYGRTLRVTNSKLPFKNIDKIEFVLDSENNIREFNKENNFMQMSVAS